MRPRAVAPQKHRWFDQFLIPRTGTPLQRMADEVRVDLAKHEAEAGSRVRKRKAIDQARHDAAVSLAIANLAYMVLNKSDTGRLAVNVRRLGFEKTRYDNPALGVTFRKNVEAPLEDMGMLVFEYSKTRGFRGEASSIVPTQAFADRVAQAGISLADFTRDTEELILLDQVEYTDTPITNAYRATLRSINAFLDASDIGFLDDNGPVVDPYRRTLRRHFKVYKGEAPSFNKDGRLFGGFWENLKADRRTHIRISGEPIAILDFSSMFPRLAYTKLGLTPPDGDLYALDDLPSGYRSGIKLATNTFFFDHSKHRSVWPKVMGVGVGTDEDAKDPMHPAAQYDGLLPAGWTVGRTRQAILQRHPAFRKLHGKSVGHQLMFIESEVMIAVLTELQSRNVVALPLHDGLLVARSKAEEAMCVMGTQSKKVTGVQLPVARKA